MLAVARQISFKFYGLAVVNALILAKDHAHWWRLCGFADRLDDKPLIYPAAFKSIAFSALLMLFLHRRGTAVGLFHGKSAAESVPQIGGGGLVGIAHHRRHHVHRLGSVLCVQEIARAVGAAKSSAR